MLKPSVLLVLIVFSILCSCYYPVKGQHSSSSWFDDTFDDFIRQAQDNGDATDVQVSTCKISSKELVATAQATAARVLRGVCNPNEIEDRLGILETQLGHQINELKSMIVNYGERLAEQEQEGKRNYRRLSHLVNGIRVKSGDIQPDLPPVTQTNSRNGNGNNNGGNHGYNNGGSVVVNDHTYSPSAQPLRAEEIVEDTDDGPYTFSGLNTKSGLVGPRSEEMIRHNNTLHMENGKRAYSYYWIITGITNKLNNWPQRRVLRSNSFYIYPGGYRMYLKAIPRYTLNTMYLHAGITKGENDDNVEWPFTYKMRVQVLVQDDDSNSRIQDLKSRIWDPKELCSGTNWKKPVFGDNSECVGLGFPHDVIRNFIWMDRLVVRLIVFLD